MFTSRDNLFPKDCSSTGPTSSKFCHLPTASEFGTYEPFWGCPFKSWQLINVRKKRKCVLICGLVSTKTTLGQEWGSLPPEAGLQGLPASVTLSSSILTPEMLSESPGLEFSFVILLPYLAMPTSDGNRTDQHATDWASPGVSLTCQSGSQNSGKCFTCTYPLVSKDILVDINEQLHGRREYITA